MKSIDILGSSVSITRLGFGCARIFGGGERRGAQRLVETALGCGIRHFDTAPAYGSEEVLGSILANTSEVTIATKIGLPRFNGGVSPARRFFGPLYRRSLRPMLSRFPALKSRLVREASTRSAAGCPVPRRRLARDEVLREFEDSLRRLRRSTIDLYLLHEPDGIEITDELRETFASLQRDGLVGAYGLAFGGISAEAAAFGTVMQCRYSIMPAAQPRPVATPIYHGVIRFGPQQHRAPAGALIERVLGDQPGCAVIFSAGTRRQMLQVCSHLTTESISDVG